MTLWANQVKIPFKRLNSNQHIVGTTDLCEHAISHVALDCVCKSQHRTSWVWFRKAKTNLLALDKHAAALEREIGRTKKQNNKAHWLRTGCLSIVFFSDFCSSDDIINVNPEWCHYRHTAVGDRDDTACQLGVRTGFFAICQLLVGRLQVWKTHVNVLISDGKKL